MRSTFSVVHDSTRVTKSARRWRWKLRKFKIYNVFIVLTMLHCEHMKYCHIFARCIVRTCVHVGHVASALKCMKKQSRAEIMSQMIWYQKPKTKTKKSQKSHSPVHWCPSRCWWVWLFRTTRTSCAADHQWTASPGACTAGVVPADPPCPRPATKTCGTRTGTVCCPPVRCQWAPSTFGWGPISGSTRAVWETSACEQHTDIQWTNHSKCYIALVVNDNLTLIYVRKEKKDIFLIKHHNMNYDLKRTSFNSNNKLFIFQ